MKKIEVDSRSQRRHETANFQYGGHQAHNYEAEQCKLSELEIQGGIVATIERAVEKGD